MSKYLYVVILTAKSNFSLKVNKKLIGKAVAGHNFSKDLLFRWTSIDQHSYLLSYQPTGPHRARRRRRLVFLMKMAKEAELYGLLKGRPASGENVQIYVGIGT